MLTFILGHFNSNRARQVSQKPHFTSPITKAMHFLNKSGRYYYREHREFIMEHVTTPYWCNQTPLRVMRVNRRGGEHAEFFFRNSKTGTAWEFESKLTRHKNGEGRALVEPLFFVRVLGPIINDLSMLAQCKKALQPNTTMVNSPSTKFLLQKRISYSLPVYTPRGNTQNLPCKRTASTKFS